jgi:hypothetical protein
MIRASEPPMKYRLPAEVSFEIIERCQ